MKPGLRIILMATLVVIGNNVAFASDSMNYGLLEESSFLFLSVACLVAAGVIFSSLRGGSLAKPWLFFSGGFALAAIGAGIQVMDTVKIILHQYDFGLAMLFIRASSMLLILIGLILYKKESA